jgi:hypothetical protein
MAVAKFLAKRAYRRASRHGDRVSPWIPMRMGHEYGRKHFPTTLVALRFTVRDVSSLTAVVAL